MCVCREYVSITPFARVPAMERASDVTRSFLDLRLLPALPLAWLPSWQRHSPQVSWQPIQIEAARPIYGYLQSPDFTPATSSPPSRFITLPARLLAFFFIFIFLKYTIAEMKATSKLRPPHPSAERPLQGVRGSFLSVNCPHADITSSNVPYFSSFTLF